MNPAHLHSVSTKRRIRWLVPFKHTIFLEPIHPEPAGSVSFEQGSESVMSVSSKVSMPGFGELKVKEGEHFEFIESSLN